MKRQQICFYSPYFPNHFGGGEKHLLDIAQVVSQFADVFIAVSVATQPKSLSLQHVKEAYQAFTGSPLDDIRFIESPLGSGESAISKTLWTGQFDQLFYITDGSVFVSLARRNHLHFQIPFTTGPTTLWQKFKLRFWQCSNTNSQFTLEVIKRSWPQLRPTVLHPMVNTSIFEPGAHKKKTIISVGRFFKQLHSKRQDVLIEVFKKLPSAIQKQWRLELLGSVEDADYVERLRQQAKGLAISFHTDVSREELIKRVSQAQIYWHAAGFGVDEGQHPEGVEHFGISTIEAMASGAVPIVYYAGGQKEILGVELSNLGWQSVDECVKITTALIHNKAKMTEASVKAIARAEHFGYNTFQRRVKAIFELP